MSLPLNYRGADSHAQSEDAGSWCLHGFIPVSLMISPAVVSNVVERVRSQGEKRILEKEFAMKQYLLAVQLDETVPESEEETREQMARTGKVTDEMRAAGSWVFVGGLRPSHATTVVRPSGGTTTMTDGPFAETKEQLGGFWVIQCDDLDQALFWADKCALACGRPIEVRPFSDGSED
jgi:hypothetical protein